MKKTLKLMAALFVGAMFMGACQQAEEPAMEPGQNDAVVTRAYGDKTPKVTIYVETNDVNPLNAGDYVLPNGEPYADIVELFAANIHKRTVNGVTEPVLYLNDKMTNLMENDGYLTYIKPLQDKGIKVILTILGDHQGIGFTNLNDTQATQFAKILAHAVEKYGLDGIGFDDEYSKVTSTVQGSYGNLIKKLRAEMPADKLITLFQFGNYGSSQIGADAGALIDYVYTNFGWNTSIGVAGVSKDRYAPLAINVGNLISSMMIPTYRNYASSVATNGYGAIMHFNLRRTSDRNQTQLFSAIADGAWGELSVSVASTPSNAGDRPQDWTFVTGGHDITMDDVNAQ